MGIKPRAWDDCSTPGCGGVIARVGAAMRTASWPGGVGVGADAGELVAARVPPHKIKRPVKSNPTA